LKEIDANKNANNKKFDPSNLGNLFRFMFTTYGTDHWRMRPNSHTG
jgi:hypothetical protein